MVGQDKVAARFGKPFQPGEVIFRQGEFGETMFVVQQGQVELTQKARDRQAARVIAHLSVGDFFGEMALLNDKPRSATATAVDNVKLLVIDRHTFEGMVAENAEIALRLIRRFARRVDDANELIDILLHRDPKARLILGLSREADMRGIDRGDGSVTVPTNSKLLAQQLGLDEESVNEVLLHLVKLGIVSYEPKGLLVRDLNRMTDFLDTRPSIEVP